MNGTSSILWTIAFRNVWRNRTKSLIVGFLLFLCTGLVVFGNALVDAVDLGMERSVTQSVSGHLQIYSASAKDDLALFGDEFAGMPDIGVIPDFGLLANVVRKVPNVKAVVPMGVDFALGSSGNELDRWLALLRQAVRARPDHAVALGAAVYGRLRATGHGLRIKSGTARSYYIGTDHTVGGRTLGTAARALLEARGVTEGGYVQFAGFTDNDNARSRMNGVKETIGPAYAERDRMADEMDLPRARDNVRNATQNHKDLAALVGIWAYNAPAIADVVTESGTRDKYVIATFDAQDLAIGHMETSPRYMTAGMNKL